MYIDIIYLYIHQILCILIYETHTILSYNTIILLGYIVYRYRIPEYKDASRRFPFLSDPCKIRDIFSTQNIIIFSM